MTEKTTTEKTKPALPEVGYYTDANGLTWQLSAAEAGKLGYTAPDAPRARPRAKPAGPPVADPTA